jgi:hypothetical protein
MCHITKDWQGKFLQRAFLFDDLDQDWYYAIERGVFLSSLRQTTKIVNCVEDLI